MRLVVTGAAGFIGSALVRSVVSSRVGDSYSIVAFDSLIRTKSWAAIDAIEAGAPIELVQGDILESTSIRDACRGADAVVHCAAETSVDASFEQGTRFHRANVEGSRQVAQAALAEGVRAFVHFSTDEVYGEVLHGNVPETAQLRPTNPYSQSKAAAEAAVFEVFKGTDVRVIVVRPSNNYGPWQTADNLIPRFVTLMSTGQRAPLYGSGEQSRCWVHVDDTVRAVMTLLEDSAAEGIFNIGGEELSNQRVVQHLLDQLDLDWSWVEHVEGRPVHDARYSNDEARLRSMGYERTRRFVDEIGAVVAHYRSRSAFAD